MEWPARTARPDPQVVEHPAEEGGVAGHALRTRRETERAAVPGRVDGDHLEAEIDQPRQGLRVEDALGREAVDDDERHPAPADRHADRVAVSAG